MTVLLIEIPSEYVSQGGPVDLSNPATSMYYVLKATDVCIQARREFGFKVSQSRHCTKGRCKINSSLNY